MDDILLVQARPRDPIFLEGKRERGDKLRVLKCRSDHLGAEKAPGKIAAGAK